MGLSIQLFIKLQWRLVQSNLYSTDPFSAANVASVNPFCNFKDSMAELLASSRLKVAAYANGSLGSRTDEGCLGLPLPVAKEVTVGFPSDMVEYPGGSQPKHLLGNCSGTLNG